MARIEYVTEEAASGDVLEMLRDYSEEHGVRSLMRSSLANHPPLLEVCVFFFQKAMREGDLARELKETVGVVVSQTNGCSYCAASHRESLTEVFGLLEERVDAIRGGSFEDLPRRHRVAAAFAAQAAEDPHRLTDEHFEALHEAGFTDENVVELLGVVGLFAFVNTYGIAMDLQPSDRDAALPNY